MSINEAMTGYPVCVNSGRTWCSTPLAERQASSEKTLCKIRAMAQLWLSPRLKGTEDWAHDASGRQISFRNWFWLF